MSTVLIHDRQILMAIHTDLDGRLEVVEDDNETEKAKAIRALLTSLGSISDDGRQGWPVLLDITDAEVDQLEITLEQIEDVAANRDDTEFFIYQPRSRHSGTCGRSVPSCPSLPCPG